MRRNRRPRRIATPFYPRPRALSSSFFSKSTMIVPLMSKVGVVSKPRAQPRTFAAAARSFRRLGYGLRCGGSGLRRDGSRLQLDQHLEQQLILPRSTLLMLVGALAGKGTDGSRLCRGHSGTLSVLQLWRCDADFVNTRKCDALSECVALARQERSASLCPNRSDGQIESVAMLHLSPAQFDQQHQDDCQKNPLTLRCFSL